MVHLLDFNVLHLFADPNYSNIKNVAVMLVVSETFVRGGWILLLDWVFGAFTSSAKNTFSGPQF